MTQPKIHSLSLILCFIFVIEAQNTIDEKHEVVLNVEHHVALKWRVDGKDIFFEMSAKTQGYVAIGFSPNGGMPNSDIVVGWVENGNAFISDRHALGTRKPEADKSKDYQLLYGYEKDGKTTIGFKRKLQTCDPRDYTITTDTSRIIWAVNDKDPSKEDNFLYHGRSRGVRSVVLLDSSFKMRELPDDAKYFDVLMPNVSVPDDDTTYWCSPFLLPKFDSPVQLIRFDTIVQEGHEDLVHHMILYACNGDYESIKHWADLCIRENMPPDIQRCIRVIYAWAIGAGPFEFPDHVGLSLGGPDDPTFVYIEMHYDNPGLRSDFVDSSGLRLYYIPPRRQYDLDVWMVGESFVPTHMIPPNETAFKTYGYCSGECTKASMSEDANVFAVFLHGHLALSQINLQQYRNGKLIDEVRDDNYDFNLQETRIIPGIVYKPGDEFMLTCAYNTMDRENITFGGIATHEEMCLAFVYYYPRKGSLSYCVSTPTLDSYSDVFELNKNISFNTILNNLTELDTNELKEGLTEVANKGRKFEICGFVFNKTFDFPTWFKSDERQVQHEACAMAAISGNATKIRSIFCNGITTFIYIILAVLIYG